ASALASSAGSCGPPRTRAPVAARGAGRRPEDGDMADRPDPSRVLYLVDGSNNLYRAFFAIRGLSTSQGLPTNAIYGFTSMLRKLLREQAPLYLGVAFDLAGPTFRHEAFADYKANRPETPHDLVVQIPYVKEVCRVLGVPVLESSGFEADDLI